MAQVAQDIPENFKREIFDPTGCRKKVPGLTDDVWLYRYTRPVSGAGGNKVEWSLSIATQGAPQSGSLSLGGFRIVPADRAALSGFDPDKEAIGLACGMEEKVSWSRLMRVGGPLAIKNIDKIVGGKCVLLPSAGARVGEPRDMEILQFAATCLHDMERVSGVRLTTGQDLGHGILSDGKTQSLQYLHELFKGSILSDTSKPTAEGNYQVLVGMLEGVGIAITNARVGLIGCGNIGTYMLNRLQEEGVSPWVLDSAEPTRERLKAQGVSVFEPHQKKEFLSLPMHALVVNASGGTLDADAVAAICQNKTVAVICGSENLAMSDASLAENLKQAKKIYCPTELGGMMGYLTAVEEYLCQDMGKTFDVHDMFTAARTLHQGGLKATAEVLKSNYTLSFEDAIRAVY